MRKPNATAVSIATGLGVAVIASMMGCVGYVGDPGVSVGVVAPGPVEFWGGPGGQWGRGDVRGYSQRGAASRGAAHGGGRKR
jgi:hypothetical protein